MYICLTEVDAKTGKPCTVEPMKTGPNFPKIKGFKFVWADESNWPIEEIGGIYLNAPRYYGTCDDDANIDIPGVLETLSELDYNRKRNDEIALRKPFNSWILDLQNMTWRPPVPYPNDNKNYRWDEENKKWQSI
jgi:hypothetical protein